MSKTATFSGTVRIAAAGRQQPIDLGPITNATSPGTVTRQDVIAGDLLQTVSAAPIAQMGVLIIPRAGSGYNLGIRHANTETIIPIDATYPSFIPIDGTTANVTTTWLLNSSAAGIVDVVTG